ncbi:hypothetical protein KVT40_007072 [Elsinoe batatas]|uniref:BTB domain-containing protein n=1 Tax=Elsinoe batatas TaxID=2601811 RepID=A0A8K0PD58_9PEZI|nr:hypothetical protein KVT40_007072 [Elsinoe batatas]
MAEATTTYPRLSLNDSEFSDATIRSSRQDFQVHKHVVAAGCDVVKTMIRQARYADKPLRLDWTSMNPDIVALMVKHIYHEHADFDSLSISDLRDLFCYGKERDMPTFCGIAFDALTTREFDISDSVTADTLGDVLREVYAYRQDNGAVEGPSFTVRNLTATNLLRSPSLLQLLAAYPALAERLIAHNRPERNLVDFLVTPTTIVSFVERPITSTWQPAPLQSTRYLEMYPYQKYTLDDLVATDATICTAHGKLLLHKSVLAVGSSYFKAMFLSHFKEGSSGESDLEAEDPVVLDMVIKFMYGQEDVIDGLKILDATKLYMLADKLFVPTLQAAVMEILVRYGNAPPDKDILDDLAEALGVIYLVHDELRRTLMQPLWKLICCDPLRTVIGNQSMRDALADLPLFALELEARFRVLRLCRGQAGPSTWVSLR